MNIDKVKAKLPTWISEPMPAGLSAIAQEKIIDLDVRDDLRNGVEPFGRIMQAVAQVDAGGVLRIRAIFEPAPLYAVLAKRGFGHWTEKLADDDWRVWFYDEADEADEAHDAHDAHEAVVPDEKDLVVLDVRGLEPPEPLERTLAALESLPLLQINVRVPQLLLPMLEQRGFEYVLLNEQADQVRGLIRRRAPEKRLDVRVIPPREKHPAIFQTFDALNAGDAFVLVNDHDPFPLRFQFEAERTNRFTWDYLEKGPVVWRVRIGKP